MDLYYYRVSKKGSANFATSLGDNNGVVNFNIEDIESYLPNDFVQDNLQSSKFQIWGIPNTSIASLKTAKSISKGDWLMILGSEDTVNYIGQFEGTFFDEKGLSEYIWGDNIYSQIIILQGKMVEASWKIPHDLFGYSNYKPDNKLTRVAVNRNPGTMKVIEEISKYAVGDLNLPDLVHRSKANLVSSEESENVSPEDILTTDSPPAKVSTQSRFIDPKDRMEEIYFLLKLMVALQGASLTAIIFLGL